MENRKIHIQVQQAIPRYSCVTSSGEVADSNQPTHENHVMGITEGAIGYTAPKGDWGDVTTSGRIYDQTWSWTPGAALYLNGTVISETAPGVGFVQRIGWAITPTEIVVDFAPVSTGPVGPPGPAGPVGPAGPPGPTGPGVTYGTALLDFGAFPGVTEATMNVADAGIQITSIINVWPAIVDTVDHTENEAYLEEFSCESSGVAAGSFNLLSRPRVGLSFGTYQFNYLYV